MPCQPEVPFDTGDAVLRVMTKHLPAAVEPAPSPADGVQDTLKKLGELSEMGKALTFDALLGLSATLVRRVQEECPRIKLKTPKDLLNMTTALEMVNRQIHFGHNGLIGFLFYICFLALLGGFLGRTPIAPQIAVAISKSAAAIFHPGPDIWAWHYVL